MSIKEHWNGAKPFAALTLSIALLIVLAGIVYYLASPKYTFDANGRTRKNVFTGTVESWHYNHGWQARK